jgi:hypothetical protein
MQVNRASATSLRATSVRTDASAAIVSAPVDGVAAVAGGENDLSDQAPRQHFPQLVQDDDVAPESLIDAIDTNMIYHAATALLRREGMVGLLLNRNA